MLLNGKEILNCIKTGEIKITPFDESLIGVDSLDIRLGNSVLIAKKINKVIDPKNPENFWEEKEIPDSGYILQPNSFVLGSTLEGIGIGKSISAQIEGRSSIGRLGIMVHITAGLIHTGWGTKEPSSITLEIYSINPNPVKLYKGMKIAQLAFFKLSSESDKAYDDIGNYVAQKKAMPPKAIK